MVLLNQLDAFRRRDDAEDLDVAGTRLLQQVDGFYRAASSGQHGIDHQHVALRESWRQL